MRDARSVSTYGVGVGAILAETVSIDGGLIALILAILLLLVAATVAAMVAGVIWAKRAARGSSLALAGFVAVASTEFVLATLGLANSGGFVATVFGLGFLGHAGLYAYERTKATGGASTSEDSPPTP